MNTTPASSRARPAAPTWDPAQYQRFAKERARPFLDLLARIDHASATDIADLGCGPGNLTADVSDLWPAAHVVGVDSSLEMITEASGRARSGRLDFELGNLKNWQPGRQFDIILSNATLQWVPDHLDTLGDIAAHLKPGGVFAFQVPGNFNEPTHTILHDIVSSDRWQRRLAGQLSASPYSHDPSDYLSTLIGLGLSSLAWETTYFQVLQGDNAIVEWMKGTALRPVLTVLEDDPSEKAAFLDEYGALVAAAYPCADFGTVLPYRRVFAVGVRPGGSLPPAIEAHDHTQIAMPVGQEAAGRAFYCGLLGMVEVAKPPVLAARGGCWFKAHGAEVHLGADASFRPAQKAHVALVVTDLDAMAAKLEAGGSPVIWDDELAPRRRIYVDDPFGNRMEIMERRRAGASG